MTEPLQKEILVVAGCGLHGAWQVGVLDTLIKRDKYKPDAAVGCSVGSTTVMVLSRLGFTPEGIDAVTNGWLGLKNVGSIFGRNWTFPVFQNGVYNGDPLKNLIGKIIQGKPALVPITLAVCDFLIGETAYFTPASNKVELMQSSLDGAFLSTLEAMEASYSIPVALNLFQNRWADGGTLDTAPVSAAVAAGATSITLILGYSLDIDKWTVQDPKAWDVGERAIDIMTTRLVVDDVLFWKDKVKLRIIVPDVDLPIGMLDVSPDKIREVIKMGKQAV